MNKDKEKFWDALKAPPPRSWRQTMDDILKTPVKLGTNNRGNDIITQRSQCLDQTASRTCDGIEPSNTLSNPHKVFHGISSDPTYDED